MYIEKYFSIYNRDQIRPGHEFPAKNIELYSSKYTYYINNSDLEMEVMINSKGYVFTFKIRKEKHELEIQIFGGDIISFRKIGNIKSDKLLMSVDDVKKEIHDYFFELYPDEIRDIKLNNLLN